jgi:hypothetical protein
MHAIYGGNLMCIYKPVVKYASTHDKETPYNTNIMNLLRLRMLMNHSFNFTGKYPQLRGHSCIKAAFTWVTVCVCVRVFCVCVCVCVCVCGCVCCVYEPLVHQMQTHKSLGRTLTALAMANFCVCINSNSNTLLVFIMCTAVAHV